MASVFEDGVAPANARKRGAAGGRKAEVPHEDGVPMKALTYANKCRLCSAEMPAGGSGWYNKDAESGRRLTCNACHDANVADGEAAARADGADGADGAAAPPPAVKKMRAPMPKVSEEVLRSKDGLTKLYKIASSKGAIRRTSDVASDLGHLLRLYREWGNKLVPALDFDEIIARTEKLGGTRRVREHLLFLRDVHLGLRSLDEHDDELAHAARRAAGEPAGDACSDEEGALDAGIDPTAGGGAHEADGEGAVADGASGATLDTPTAAGAPLTAAQRERIEAQRAAALERLAARQATAAAAAAAAAQGGVCDDDDYGADADEAAALEAEMLAAQRDEASAPRAARGGARGGAPGASLLGARARDEAMAEDEMAALEAEMAAARASPPRADARAFRRSGTCGVATHGGASAAGGCAEPFDPPVARQLEAEFETERDAPAARASQERSDDRWEAAALREGEDGLRSVSADAAAAAHAAAVAATAAQAEALEAELAMLDGDDF